MFCWPVERVLQGLHSRQPSLLRAAGCHLQPEPISTSSPANHTWLSGTTATVIYICAAHITISVISALVSGIIHNFLTWQDGKGQVKACYAVWPRTCAVTGCSFLRVHVPSLWSATEGWRRGQCWSPIKPTTPCFPIKYSSHSSLYVLASLFAQRSRDHAAMKWP